MSNLHDDMLAKVQKLMERAKAAAAKGTQMEQNWTDVSAQLDEVTKILDNFIKDDASQGGSTGGATVSDQAKKMVQTQHYNASAQQQGATTRGSDPSGSTQPGASDRPAADSAKEQGWQAR